MNDIAMKFLEIGIINMLYDEQLINENEMKISILEIEKEIKIMKIKIGA